MHRPSAIFTAVGGSVRLRSLRKLLRLPKSSLPNLLTSGGKERKSSRGVLRQGEGMVAWDHVQTTMATTTRETTTRHDDMFYSGRERASKFGRIKSCPDSYTRTWSIADDVHLHLGRSGSVPRTYTAFGGREGPVTNH